MKESHRDLEEDPLSRGKKCPCKAGPPAEPRNLQDQEGGALRQRLQSDGLLGCTVATGSTLYLIGLYMYIIYNYCGERCHMKYQLRPFLGCSINMEEEMKGRKRRGREKRRGGSREGRKGRGTEQYNAQLKIHEGRKNQSFHR